MKGEGLIPDAEMSAALGYAGGSMAYKAARRAALQGVDPSVAASFGNSVGTWSLCFYVYAGFSMVACFAMLFMGTQAGLCALWAIGHGVLVALLYHRLQVFRSSDPTTKLRYKLSNRLIVVASVLWSVMAFAGVWQFFTTPLYPSTSEQVEVEGGILVGDVFIDTYTGYCGRTNPHPCTYEEQVKLHEVDPESFQAPATTPYSDDL